MNANVFARITKKKYHLFLTLIPKLYNLKFKILNPIRREIVFSRLCHEYGPTEYLIMIIKNGQIQWGSQFPTILGKISHCIGKLVPEFDFLGVKYAPYDNNYLFIVYTAIFICREIE